MLAPGGPTVTASPDVIVLGDDNKPVGPRPGRPSGPGGHVPLGYYCNDPGQDRSAMFAEVDGKRYAIPGDMARVEDDGTLTLLGRGNTCVNSGGEKVFPEEVEGALKSHPDVFDALVIGMPDDLLGQRVAALVQPRPGAEPDPAALQEHVRGHIASRKVPRTIWLTGTIRRTVSGKADYTWAREYVAPTSLRPGHAAGECPGRSAPLLRPARHRASRRRVHPVRARRRRGQPGRRPRGARLRPVQRPGRAGHGPDWMDQNTGGAPVRHRRGHAYRVPTEGGQQDLSQLIPQTHQDFVEQTLLRLGCAAAAGRRAGRRRRARLAALDRAQHVEVALDHPARLIANALGPPPPDVIASAHERGMLVAALAGKAEHARRQVASGVDIVVAQGYEAGGHTGEIATMVLVPEIVDAVGAAVPVLAAGGIGCGRQVAAALALGAVGAWMGSAWLVTSEYQQLPPRPRCSRRCSRPRARIRPGPGSTAASPARLLQEPLDRGLGTRRRPRAAAACRCRTCWSARRTSA